MAPGYTTTEFWLTIITALASAIGGIMLLRSGDIAGGTTLLLGANGGSGLYAIARGIAKRNR